MNYQKVKQSGKCISALFFVLCLLLVASDADAQSNRNKRKNNFSKSGKSYAVIRHGIALTAGTTLDLTPMVGLGYSCSQYFGIGNRYMQQSLTYQLGLGDEMIHNVVGTFHASYIGTWDMNPFIYGIAAHFAMGKDKFSETNMGNLYLRPEFGLAFPMKYQKRSQERLPVTASLTYGYDIGLFNRRGEFDNSSVDKSDYPWTSRNHHVVTFRINFNFANVREFQ